MKTDIAMTPEQEKQRAENEFDLREVIRTREVCGRHFEMQVIQIKSGEDAGKYQATYYHGAQEMIVAEVADTVEQAADNCDVYLNNLFEKSAAERAYEN